MTDKPDKTEKWADRADNNIDKWGVEPPADIVLSMMEELAEITEEIIENSEVSTGRPNIEEREMMYYLVEITVLGNELRKSLEKHYEDENGDPVPPEERPDVLGGIHESKPIHREIDDLGPLIVQLVESVDEYSKW